MREGRPKLEVENSEDTCDSVVQEDFEIIFGVCSQAN